MLSPASSQLRLFVCGTATDMRKGFDGLSGLCRSLLSQDPTSGQVFVFFNRRRDQVKACGGTSRDTILPLLLERSSGHRHLPARTRLAPESGRTAAAMSTGRPEQQSRHTKQIPGHRRPVQRRHAGRGEG